MSARPLIIVESPTKVKTIKRFLGSGYDVEASGGHVRDLPKSRMGIDIANDYEPSYIAIRGKGETIRTLKEKAKKASKVYLATDPDREGEAIAWHLQTLLQSAQPKCSRISFNEITKDAVKNAIASPRAIDENLVDAQQARRALDRVTGYSVSPLLWKKVKRGLSAGRVQSSTLNLICVREKEIEDFVPEEYWSLDLSLAVSDRKERLVLQLDTKEHPLPDEAAVKAVLKALEGKDFVLTEKDTQRKHTHAPLPFTTSTLQQEASRILNFSPSKTMRIAQNLYEGVRLEGEGTVGLITYLRTDSTRISQEADAAAREYIGEAYGKNYVGRPESAPKAGEHIQDAHEAIRPSSIRRTPQSVRNDLGRDEYRLYKLIWERFAASRMADYEYDSTRVTVSADGYDFRATAAVPAFDGFRLVYSADEEKSKKDKVLKSISEEDRLSDPAFEPKQHFTQPLPHYTEASLVQAMEACGIGRPSTYAPTIATLSDRHYILKEGRNLFVTELGETVNNIILQSVPMLADKDFTAEMETELDKVAEGDTEWKEVLRSFCPPFLDKVETASKNLERVKVADEETDEVCELCGRKMVIKFGPHGRFLACPGFPECRNTRPLLEKAGCKCPKCGGELIIRKTKKGRRFYACENAPECDFMSWNRPKTDAKK